MIKAHAWAGLYNGLDDCWFSNVCYVRELKVDCSMTCVARVQYWYCNMHGRKSSDIIALRSTSARYQHLPDSCQVSKLLAPRAWWSPDIG